MDPTVRFWHFCDIRAARLNVRLQPLFGRRPRVQLGPLVFRPSFSVQGIELGI